MRISMLAVVSVCGLIFGGLIAAKAQDDAKEMKNLEGVPGTPNTRKSFRLGDRRSGTTG